MGNKPRLVKHMKELRGTYVGFAPVRLAVRCASVNLASRRCGELDGEMEPWRHYRALRATDMQPPVEMRRRRAAIERKCGPLKGIWAKDSKRRKFSTGRHERHPCIILHLVVTSIYRNPGCDNRAMRLMYDP
jgi:hypothetical protein